jgi:hypothetical protein
MIYGVKSEPGKEPCDWKVVPFVDVGVEEQFQARFLDLANLFNATTWNQGRKKAIMDRFWSMVLEGFTPAFLHLRQAIKLSNIPNTPVLNLRNEYDAFYSKLWTAYEHRFGDLASEMGYKVRFMFAENEDTFQKKSKAFAMQHDISEEVIVYLNEQRNSWHNKLVKIRNKVVQHAQIPAETVPVIYQPSTAQAYFDNCWQMAEWLTAILMGKNLSTSLQLYDLLPEQTENGRKAFTVQFKSGVRFVK